MRFWLRAEIKALIGNMRDLIAMQLTARRRKWTTSAGVHAPAACSRPVVAPDLCYASQWRRDVERLENIYTRVNMMPLGVGALSGHPRHRPRAVCGRSGFRWRDSQLARCRRRSRLHSRLFVWLLDDHDAYVRFAEDRFLLIHRVWLCQTRGCILDGGCCHVHSGAKLTLLRERETGDRERGWD